MRRLLPRSVKSRLKAARDSSLLAALKTVRWEAALALRSWRNAGQFAQLNERQHMQLHLGCGSDIRPGWINVDMEADRANPVPAEATFIAYDLRRRLPLRDGSCTLIYSSHFWEHLEYMTGFHLMRECHRVLESGGIFRMALPDFARVFNAYSSADAAFFDGIPTESLIRVPGAETLLDQVHYAVYQYGEHRCLYDSERACKMLVQAGFASVRPVAFDPAVDVDLPLRVRYSFYIEAVR